VKIFKLTVVLIRLAAFTREYVYPKTYYSIRAVTGDYVLQNVNLN